MSLSGKTILITRASSQTEDFVRAIKRHNGTPIVFSTIEIVPPANWEACDRAIDGLYMYDGLIFTSTNGVEWFFKRLTEHNTSIPGLKAKMIFVVGEKTKQAVEEHGLNVTAMPEKFTSLDLARILQQEDFHGKSFLFPRGNLGENILQDTLKLLGAHVNSIIVYQTQQPKKENIDQLRAMLLHNQLSVVTFTSPSTVKNFAAMFPNEEVTTLPQHCKIAAIGPVTAKALDALHLTADIIAGHSTVESLADSIAEYFETQNQSNVQNIKSIQ